MSAHRRGPVGLEHVESRTCRSPRWERPHTRSPIDRNFLRDLSKLRLRIPLGTPSQLPGMTWHFGNACCAWAEIWAKVGPKQFVDRVHRSTTCLIAL